MDRLAEVAMGGIFADPKDNDHVASIGEVYVQPVNDRFWRLFRTLTQAVVVQSADGMIIDANLAAERLLGLPRDEMLGSETPDPLWDVVDEDGDPLSVEAYPGLIAGCTGKPVTGKILGVVNRRSQQTRWVSVDAIPQFRPGDANPVEVFVFFIDLTDRNSAEPEWRPGRPRSAGAEGTAVAGNETTAPGPGIAARPLRSVGAGAKVAQHDASTCIAGLPPRCRDVLNGVIAGQSNKIIAFNLGISPRTVEAHRAQMMRRLGARNMADAIRAFFEADRDAYRSISKSGSGSP